MPEPRPATRRVDDSAADMISLVRLGLPVHQHHPSHDNPPPSLSQLLPQNRGHPRTVHRLIAHSTAKLDETQRPAPHCGM